MGSRRFPHDLATERQVAGELGQIKALGQDHSGGNRQTVDVNPDLPYSELSALPETGLPASLPTPLLLTGWRRK